MKIAITASGDGLESLVDDRFGRCNNFVIYDTETKEVLTIDNDAKNDSSGAGGKAVRTLSLNKVNVAIVPRLGPKALDAFRAFDIKAYEIGDNKTVEESINAFNDKKLNEVSIVVEEHSGLRKA